MANSVPSLSNYNYHMFEPSPIETSLAASVDNPATPSAFPLLMAYRAQNLQGNSQYQSNVDQMHQIQQDEGLRAQKTQMANSFLTSLPHLALPGAAQAAYSAGVLPDGTDLTGLAAGGQQAADAKNMSEMMTGAGHAGQGNVNIPDATLQPLLPGAHMGPNPLIASTAMKEAGAKSRHNSNGGMATVHEPVGDVGPDQPTVSYKVPIGSIPGLQLAPKAKVGPQSMNDAGPKTAQQVAQLVLSAMPNIAASNPQVHGDIAAGAVNGMPNVISNPYGDGFVIQGAKGQYSASGLA